jgi:threonine/homoserine/homoserine lactone efflux protein
MLEDDLKEIVDERIPALNLRQALFALGYAILAGGAEYLSVQSFRPDHSVWLSRILVGLYFLLTIVSGAFAFLACRNALNSLRTDKNRRNYIALVIGGLLLLDILRLILVHF